MYNGVDQTWRNLPTFMDLVVARNVLRDIRKYADSVGLTSVSIVFHGGEPMLFPVNDYRQLLRAIDTELVQSGIDVNLSIQTNATILRDETLELLLDAQVGFGVSVDLSDKSHDAYRVDKRGRGTSSRVRNGMEKIRSASHGMEPQGGLFVIDPMVTPAAALERIASMRFPFVDILLPDETWETANEARLSDTYGPWLVEFFELYIEMPREFQVRWFQTAFKIALGGIWGSDSLGLNSAGTLIVETDGTYVLHDVLRMASREVNATERRAGDESIGDIASLSGMRAMMAKENFVNSKCTTCAHLRLCGGGHIAHRYSVERGLDNPSVYCGALFALYDRIGSAVTRVK